MRRSFVLVVVAGAAFVALVALLLFYPRGLAVVALVWLVGLRVLVTGEWRGRHQLQVLAGELRVQFTVQQAMRGFLLAIAAADLNRRLSITTAVFFAVLIFAIRFMPRLVTRLVGHRAVVAGLPGAQEVQDRNRLFDTVSLPGRNLRAAITRWIDHVEFVVAAVVTAAVFGLDVDAAVVVVIVAGSVVALGALIELLTLVLSVAGRTTDRFQDAILRALTAYQPEYVVYFSATPAAVYQIRQWLPHLLNLPRRFAIITRENNIVERVAEFAPGVPVISAPRLMRLDDMVVPSIRAVLYVNNGMKNAHMLRHTHLRHVQMLHGESDKAPSVNKFARAYDELYVAGQAAIERYAAWGVTVDPRMFRVVGRPQADEVSTQVPAGRPTVLYAPTWEGFNAQTSESSVGRLGVQLVRRLLERGDVRVIVRPHPTTGLVTPKLLQQVNRMRELVEAANAAGGDHLWSTVDGELSLVDCFNLCTIMIADISSVMADFLRSEKGLIVTDVDDLGPQEFHRSFPTAGAAWVLRADGSNIDEILTDALGPDSLRAERTRVRHHVLGDFDGPAEEVFHRTLATSIDAPLQQMPEGADEVSALN